MLAFHSLQLPPLANSFLNIFFSPSFKLREAIEQPAYSHFFVFSSYEGICEALPGTKMEPPEESQTNGQASTVTVPMATTAGNAVAEADPASEKEQISSDHSDVDEKEEPPDLKDASRRQRVLNAKFEDL